MNLFSLQRLGLAASLTLTAAAQGEVAPKEETGATSLADCIAAEAGNVELSGVVSIVRPSGTTTHGRGYLAEAGGVPIGAETRFNLASAGKMFTAVAVAQLIDAGKVRLDDPIGLWIPALTPEAAAVTVRQLMNHSSGLGNFFSPENLPALTKARTLADLLPLVASEKPSHPPGSRFQYSNTGYLLLGLLIERVSGLSYARYLDLHVFAPAGMASSGLYPGAASVQAVGMTTMPAHAAPPPAEAKAPGPARTGPGPHRQKGPLRPAAEASLHGTPAGGSYSTAADLQRFFAALVAGKLTSAAMLKEITSPQTAAEAKAGSPDLRYGFGFGVGVAEGHRWFGHNGGAPGVNVEAAVFPDDGTTVVVLSNRDPPAASQLLRKVRTLLFDPEASKACAGHQ